MNTKKLRLLAFSTLLAVSTTAVTAHAANLDPIAQREKIVKDADWEKVETVTVTMDEHSYNPDQLVFKAGKAYKLVLKNQGEKKHYFTAPEFYLAISTRKIEAPNQGEIKVPYVVALEILPKGVLELFFVPVTKGDYTTYCTIEDHRQKGMEGVLKIE